MSFLLYPLENERKPSKDLVPGVVTIFLTLHGSVLMWSQKNYLRLLLTIKFSDHLGSVA